MAKQRGSRKWAIVVAASICVAVGSTGAHQAEAGDGAFTRAELGLVLMIDAVIGLENIEFEPVTDSGIALDGMPNPILGVYAQAYLMGIGIDQDELQIDVPPPFRTTNAGSAVYLSNQQVFTMVIAQLLGAPVLSDAAISEVSLAWTLFGQPVLETSEVANDPLIGAANVVGNGSIGGEELNSFAVVENNAFAQYDNPIPTFEFFRADGFYQVWLIPGVPENLAVTSSHASEFSLESMYASQAPVPIPTEIIDLDDPELLALAAQSMRDFQLSLLTPEEYLEAVLGGAVDDTGEADVPDEPDDGEQVLDGQTETQVEEGDSADGQSEIQAQEATGGETDETDAAVPDPVAEPAGAPADDGDDVQTDPEVGGTAGDEPSGSGGSGWLRWLLILGVPVALAVAIVLFLRGRGDRLPADPKEWKPIFDDEEDEFMERLVHRGTGETIGPDDPRFEDLVAALLPPPPAIPLPYIVEQNEAMMESVSDEVSPLAEPNDPVAVEPLDQTVAVMAEPPGLDGPGDDTTERLRWFAFLDDLPVSSGGWSPVSNGALTMAHTGEVPETVDPDGWSRVFVDLETGDELHQGDPGYDAAVDELGLEPTDQVDPSIELDAQRERERQEFLDRGEVPPPELTRPIGTSDEAGLA